MAPNNPHHLPFEDNYFHEREFLSSVILFQFLISLLEVVKEKNKFF